MRTSVFGSRCVLFSAITFSLIVVDASAQVTGRRSSKKSSASGSSTQQPGSFTTGSSDEIIKYINEQIRQGWADNEVGPSPIAADEEWVRRVHLDVVGHIPDAETVEAFLKDKDPAKRAKLIDKLLDEETYTRNLTTMWTNLSIGRRTPRRVSRFGMQRFYREAFARNRPWDEVVYDVISADGHFEENGAVNYLLAQMTMRDEMVQATAKTAKLFLGLQIQCTQCHNHPFNDWQQSRFWQFNSFFRQARRVDHRKPDPTTGRLVDDYSEIVYRDFDFPVFFEKRNGTMWTVDPTFMDAKFETQAISIDKIAEDGIDLRKELAKFVVEGDKSWIAMSFVNRMWGHFFGYGFTKPIDDLGPHNPASHPDLHDRLSAEFVKSNYDVKQLIRWISNTEAYNLTSQYKAGQTTADGDWKRDAEGNPVDAGNDVDNPAAGEMPLFSHLYVKSMEAEQLYDSLIVATNAHRSGRSNWDQAEQQRQRWMQQFVIAFGTDENDEATTFNGTIPQALMMMNGELVRNAVNAEKGSYLRAALEGREPDSSKIRKLYLATLSRYPSRAEGAAATRLLNASPDKLAAYQDLFWALLNSNEFIFVH